MTKTKGQTIDTERNYKIYEREFLRIKFKPFVHTCPRAHITLSISIGSWQLIYENLMQIIMKIIEILV